MALRAVACRKCACHRPPAPRRAPVAFRHVPVRHVASKPLAAYQMVRLPSADKLHKNFQAHAPTRAIIEDAHLDRLQLIPEVLVNFADREMMHGMIKVELTMMLWSYKKLDLPDDVVRLLIENLSHSISMSAHQEYYKETLPERRENLREKASFSLEQATRSLLS